MEETILCASTGTVSVRLDDGKVLLGLSTSSDRSVEPDVAIVLTNRQLSALAEELRYLQHLFDTTMASE